MTLYGYVIKCRKCNHEWVVSFTAQKPAYCARCKDYYWNLKASSKEGT